MIVRLVTSLVRGLLRARYRVEWIGVDAVRARGDRGILFLPNHPALIDPILVLSGLHPRFRVRALSDKDQIDLPVVRWLAARFGVLPIPDTSKYGEGARGEVEGVIRACVEALRRGDNILLYPAGRIYRQRYEDLRGTSAVATILAALPEVRVVLVRTRGLWGSGFSHASGRAPNFAQALGRGALYLLASGLFFAPRRRVMLELHEPADLPRAAERFPLNRYLERFYNEDAPPNTYVPYTPWERGRARAVPEPPTVKVSGDPKSAPVAARELVLQHLAEMTGRDPATLHDEQQLARDLGLDSLSLLDLGLWLESEFGFPVDNAAALTTVGDIHLAACGMVLAMGPVELRPIPARWFAKGHGLAPRMPDGDNLLEVFLRQARRMPDRVILADQDGGVRTYRDMILGILVLKPVLAEVPGDYVGIMLPASPAATILYLAALFAGKIPVMVNWTAGVRNMTHALDLLGVRHVFTAEALVKRLEAQVQGLSALKDRFVFLEPLAARMSLADKLAAKFRSRCCWASLANVRAPAVAVVLFTSGSESLPKAVPLTHLNLLTNLRDIFEVLKIRPTDRMINMLPPFHSFGLTVTLLLPVCSGIPVVFHPKPTDGGMLTRLIEAYRVTILAGTPTFLNGIVRAAEDAHLACLRVVATGAEKCPAPLYETLARRWPGLKVLEGYGITECSPVVAINREENPRMGTIGKVLPSVEYAIVNPETGQRAVPGCAGMLLVRGRSVFGGYLHHEGAAPFVEFEGAPWYQTGDLVTEDADGILTFAGRLKRFIKLGGEMISLPAIEEVLVRAYGRSDDAGPALAVESAPQDLNPDLVLFAVRDLDREEVNRRIREAGLSPLHNIRRIRRIEQIPILGSGKTDYRRLKDMLKAQE